MAWRRIGDKPLSEPMLTQFTDAYRRHIRVHLKVCFMLYNMNAVVSASVATWSKPSLISPSAAYICVGESGQHWLVTYSAPTHDINQWCDIVNWNLRNKLQWNFNPNIKLFIHENASDNIDREMSAILSRGWDNSHRYRKYHNNRPFSTLIVNKNGRPLGNDNLAYGIGDKGDIGYNY